MTPPSQYRVVCSGKGRRHALHRYERDTLEVAEWTVTYLTVQPWTKPCRPLKIERRHIGEWQAA